MSGYLVVLLLAVLVGLGSARAQGLTEDQQGAARTRAAAYLDVGASLGRQWGTVRQFERTVADTTGRTWAGSARLGLRFPKGAATTFLVANDFALARTSLSRPRIVDAELLVDPVPGRASFWQVWPLQPYFAVYPSWGAGAYLGVSAGAGWQQFPQWVGDTQALAARYAFEAGYEWKPPWMAGFNVGARYQAAGASGFPFRLTDGFATMSSQELLLTARVQLL